MPATTEKQPQAVDYKEFIKTLELQGIALKSSSADIDLDGYWEADDKKRITYEMKSEPILVRRDHFNISSTMILTVGAPNAKKVPLRISVTLYLHFHSDHITSDFVERLCQSEVKLIVFPYFREFVMNATARMNIPPVQLPLQHMPEKTAETPADRGQK